MRNPPCIKWETGTLDISVDQYSLVFKQNPAASIHFANQFLSLVNTMAQPHWSGQTVNSPFLQRHPAIHRVVNWMVESL